MSDPELMSVQSSLPPVATHDPCLLTWVPSRDFGDYVAGRMNEANAKKAHSAIESTLALFHHNLMTALVVPKPSAQLARLTLALRTALVPAVDEGEEGLSKFSAWAGCDCGACQERRREG